MKKRYQSEQSRSNRATGDDDAPTIWRRSKPIRGTLAETYLIERRRIPRPACGWPTSIRFDPATRSLVAALMDAQHEVVAVELVELGEDSRAINEAKTRSGDTKAIPRLVGIPNGAVVRFNGSDGKPLCIVRSVEAALVIWSVAGACEVWATLGSFAYLNLPKDRRIVVCHDDYPPFGGYRRSARLAVEGLIGQGFDVVEAHPRATAKQDGADFASILLQGAGIAAVRDRIEPLVRPVGNLSPFTTPIATARARLETLASDFRDCVERWRPGDPVPVVAEDVSLGVGKTDAMLRCAVSTIVLMRSRGDLRSVAIAVPEHRLSDELVTRIAEICNEPDLLEHVSAQVWRGREAINPETGKPMCSHVDTVRKAAKVLANLDADVCGPCRSRRGCLYLGQRKQGGADIWIVSHEMLFHKPNAVMTNEGKFAALFVDESPAITGLFGIDGERLPLDSLRRGRMPLPAGENGRDVAAVLADARERLRAVLQDAASGPVLRDALIRAGFTVREAAKCRGLERRRRIVDGPWKDRQENRSVEPMMRIWSAVADLVSRDGPSASGRLTVHREEGNAKSISVCGRRNIAPAFKVPTLIADALFDETLSRPYWPQLRLAMKLEVDAPAMKIVQVASSANSKSALVPTELSLGASENAKREEERKRKRRRKLAALIKDLSAVNGGETLVVSYKELVDALDLPKEFRLAWFNATAGRDEWKHVTSIFVIGRPLPPPSILEQMAGALTGRAPVSLGAQWYPKGDVERLRRAGDSVEVVKGRAERHPDPVADAFLRRIAAGEVMQAIGRGRGVSRTPDRPLTVYVLTDVPLSLPVDDFRTPRVGATRSRVRGRNPVERQLAVAGVAFESFAVAFDAFPQLWPSREAAKKALRRADCTRGQNAPDPMRISHRKNAEMSPCSNEGSDRSSEPDPWPPSPFLRVRFQRVGKGQRFGIAIVDLRRNPNARAAIEMLIGPLAKYEPMGIRPPFTPPALAARLRVVGGTDVQDDQS